MTPAKTFDSSKYIDNFSNNMKNYFKNCDDKNGWGGNDKWWYLAQLAKAVNGVEKSILSNKKNISKETSEIAILALIIENLQKEDLKSK